MSDDFDITLERKLRSKGNGRDGVVSDVRRIELITGTGRRRRWSTDDKACIVLESLEPGASVSEVARRHGLSPQQLFAWRRKARASSHEAANAPDDRRATDPALRQRRRKSSQVSSLEVCHDTLAFAPVMIAEPARPSPPTSSQRPPIGSRAIEIAIADAVVRVIGQAETESIVAVLRAIRRVS